MKIITLFLFLLLTHIARAQDNRVGCQFELSGEVAGQNDGVVSLTYIDKEGIQVKDSCTLRDGHFHFGGKIPHPIPATFRGAVLSIADDDPNNAQFFLSPGKMELHLQKDHFKTFRLTGSQAQDENKILLKRINEIISTTDNPMDKIMEATKEFIRSNPSSYVSPFQLALFMGSWPEDTAINLYNRLDLQRRESYYGRKVLEKISVVERTSTGRPAPLFSAIDMNGKQISLSDYKGQYVLLDFWASWCIPCRKGNPELIRLYKKYHNRGLRIVGISSDWDYAAWVAAIEKDKIEIWPQAGGRPLLKDKIFDESVASIENLYGVITIPAQVLIDKNGRIIERFTASQQRTSLTEALENIFDNKPDQ